MKTGAFSFILITLFAGTALAADAVVTPPKPVVLASDPAPAAVAPAVAPATAASPGTRAADAPAKKKHVKPGKKNKAKAYAAKKISKAKLRKKQR